MQQAKEARLEILAAMRKAIYEPRAEMCPYAPRIILEQIPVEKIGEVIGPKGKIINDIIARTGAQIDIEDDGRVLVAAPTATKAEQALKMIRDIVNPLPLELGMEFDGKVVKAMDFGAFVNIVPGKDGLVHISKLAQLAGGKRIEKVEDVVNVGDTLRVQDLGDPRRREANLVPVEGPMAATGGDQTTTNEPQAIPPFVRSEPLPGLRLVTEPMPHVRSVSIGLWVDVGSRDEPDEIAGASHFLEHMLFKGTATRSAQDIANAFDAVGGEVNAYSAREHTCFYARVLDDDLPMAVDSSATCSATLRCARTSSSRSGA